MCVLFGVMLAALRVLVCGVRCVGVLCWCAMRGCERLCVVFGACVCNYAVLYVVLRDCVCYYVFVCRTECGWCGIARLHALLRGYVRYVVLGVVVVWLCALLCVVGYGIERLWAVWGGGACCWVVVCGTCVCGCTALCSCVVLCV